MSETTPKAREESSGVSDANLTTEEIDEKRHADLHPFTSVDPNWVSDDEKRALEELKQHESGVQNHKIFSADKVRYIFLFARKLDIERTIELMKHHLVCIRVIILLRLLSMISELGGDQLNMYEAE